MTENRLANEMSPAELFALAAKKISEQEYDSLTNMELGLEIASKHLMGSEIQRQLEMPESPASKKCPSCGKRARVRARNKPRAVRTLAGEVTYKRDYYYCDGCSRGFYPRDLELGVPANGELSSEVERRIIDFGINDPDAQAAQRFNMHYTTKISPNQVRKSLARLGQRLESSEPDCLEESILPPVSDENATLIVQTDGAMVSTLDGWKEAKLGVIRNDSGDSKLIEQPASDKKSTPESRYICRIGSQQQFEDALEEAMNSHSTTRPEQIVWLGDGALGYWAICNRLAPQAVQILDWYHAMEHAAGCAKELFDSKELIHIFICRIEHLLWNSQIDTLQEELQAALFMCDSESEKNAIKALVRYYRNNSHRIDYARFRENGWPIGSGRVESAHKHVIQQRMKRAGQHWSIRRAKTMVRLRAAYSTAGSHKFYRAIENAHIKSVAA